MFRQFLERVRANYMRFMSGRCGADHLNLALCLSALVFNLFSAIAGQGILAILFRLAYFASVILLVYRFLSRDTSKRWVENQKFLSQLAQMRNQAEQLKVRCRNRKIYLYCKCPQCGQKIRLPRGRGRLMVSCPGCHKEFEKKT